MRATRKSTSTKKAPSNAALSALAAVAFEAALTKEEAAEIESRYDDVWGEKRRLALYTLTQSRSQLAEAMKDGAFCEATLEVTEHILEWRTHLVGAIGIADEAIARLVRASATAALEEKANG